MILREAPADFLALIGDRYGLGIIINVTQVEVGFSKAPISAANWRDHG